jgi:hypothetical protein
MGGRGRKPQAHPEPRRKPTTVPSPSNPVRPWLASPPLPDDARNGVGILDDGSIQRLAALALGVDPKRYESAFLALCERLGIRKGPEFATWFAVAINLARDQPEFSKKHRRGRPSLGDSSPGLDYKRTQAVRMLRRKKQATGIAGRLTDITLVKEWARSRHQLFRSGDVPTLAASVSRGNKQWKELIVKYERQLDQLRAERQQLERKRSKARVAHERSRYHLKGGGLLGGLILQPPKSGD